MNFEAETSEVRLLGLPEDVEDGLARRQGARNSGVVGRQVQGYAHCVQDGGMDILRMNWVALRFGSDSVRLTVDCAAANTATCEDG